MHILIIDRDRLNCQLLQNRLEAEGHTVVVESVRKTAMDLINAQRFDVVMIDPAPLPSVRQVALPLRWEQREDYLYLLLLGHEEQDVSEIVRSGMNDMVVKPVDWQQFDMAMNNAARLTQFMNRLRDGDRHFSDTRIFGQRAFYQLVLSALDRAYRYSEQAYLLLIRVINTDGLTEAYGVEKTQEIIDSLGHYLSRLHRMSDFLGHTEQNEYVLLLLRPAVDTEPQDAADRFAIALQEFQAQLNIPVLPQLQIELWALPSAQRLVQTQLSGL